MVPADAVDSHLSDEKAVAKVGHMDVVKHMDEAGRMDVTGGSLVHVVMADAMVRMEMTGVAQSGGRLGDRIQVRILGPADGGQDRVLDAVVRSAEFVEVVR
jgi:flagella basal body P-ring formation protein FlgA